MSPSAISFPLFKSKIYQRSHLCASSRRFFRLMYFDIFRIPTGNECGYYHHSCKTVDKIRSEKTTTHYMLICEKP